MLTIRYSNVIGEIERRGEEAKREGTDSERDLQTVQAHAIQKRLQSKQEPK
jgi:hypothetical protein